MPRRSATPRGTSSSSSSPLFKSRQLVLENTLVHLIRQFRSTRLTHRRRGGAERGGRGQKVGQKDEGLFTASVTQNHKVHLLPMIQTLDSSECQPVTGLFKHVDFTVYKLKYVKFVDAFTDFVWFAVF